MRPGTPSNPPSPPSNPEETLRVVMVRLFPRAKSSLRAEGEMLVGVCALHAPAHKDIRYLDAWNNVFEIARDSGTRDEAWPRFLALYAELLRSWTAQAP
jgi:hypothetical protein